jgi:hypothetical protein
MPGEYFATAVHIVPKSNVTIRLTGDEAAAVSLRA